MSLEEASVGSLSDWEDFLLPSEFSYVGAWSQGFRLLREFGVCCGCDDPDYPWLEL